MWKTTLPPMKGPEKGGPSEGRAQRREGIEALIAVVEVTMPGLDPVSNNTVRINFELTEVTVIASKKGQIHCQ